MKCSKKGHIFEGKNRKCVCRKADIWWYVCSRCKIPGVAKYNFLPCDDCQKDPKYQKELKEGNNKTATDRAIKHYPEVVAFGHDTKTGRPYALDKKGRRIDPGQTRYNVARDPYGWAATGKIPKKKKVYI